MDPLREPYIPIQQAGLSFNKSCCNQVLALTDHIKQGYNNKLKSGAFIDLVTAYDTVWKDGLLQKLSKIISCPRLIRYIRASLGNRNFRVFLRNLKSKTHILNNGLPQGFVLVPILINVHAHYIQCAYSKIFTYANEICIQVYIIKDKINKHCQHRKMEQ